ncbi:MAG: ABC transporter permease [Bacteroidia bacterium]|nr:ABC transporter permease [Bacteroidia bacterium]
MPNTHRPGFYLVFVRELQRMVSRPIYSLLLFFLPLGFLVFFGTLMPQGLPNQLPIGVIDHDQSSLSRKIIRQIDASQQTNVAKRYLHFSEARAEVQQGKIFGFIELPKNLMKQVTNGIQPKVHFYYNQSYLIPGSLILKNLSYLMTTISGGVNLQVRQAKGQSYDESMAQILPIVPELHAIGNPWINYSVFLLNVLLPGMLQLMVLLTTVYVIGIEIKKRRSLKWYRLSGQSLWKALLGKLLPYTIAFTSVGIFYDITLFKVMQYPMNSNIAWMFLNTFTLILAAQAMAIFLIELFPTLSVALSFTGLYGILAFSYSGISFPIDGMPLAMQGLSFLFPLRGFFHIYQGVALNNLSPIYMLPHYGYQLLYLLIPIFLMKRLRNAIVRMDAPLH